MILISDRVGQLCNRLFHFSYFIANSIEYGYKIIYPCFDEYSQFFESTLTNNFLNLSVSTRITPFQLVDRAILKYLNNHRFPFQNTYFLDIRGNTEIYDLKNEAYKKLMHNNIVITKGWLFKDDENLRKHRATLLKIFKPVKKYLEEAQSIISTLRKNFDCIVGIHIRRGDYLLWNNGKYFFSDEVYIKKMEDFEAVMKTQDKTCCFFICSNEIIQKNSFSHLNTCIGQRHFIVDLYALAGCDYIIGPPSTFSYWASFYGDTPLLILENSDDDVTIDKFLYY